jgi:methylmalonyl-CoA/ethylmalonyl-CoA epimerase
MKRNAAVGLFAKPSFLTGHYFVQAELPLKEEKMAKSLDHVCILVKDIDQAMERYGKILSVMAPEALDKRVEKHEQHAGKDRYLTAVFVAPGDGCNIQLLQPLDPESPLYKRLERHGEHIHHLAFTSPHLEETVERLKDNGVSLFSDKLVNDGETPPSTRWTWIVPHYAHGALIEVMDEVQEP